MAVPKRKHSNARTGSRRSQDRLRPRQLNYCKSCGEVMPSQHVVCPSCGKYGDHDVLKLDAQ